MSLLPLPVVQEPRFVPATTFMVYVTEECNLRCSYCFVNKQPRHMSLETARKVIDYCLRPEISGEEPLSLNFFGGEPFLRAEFLLEVLAYLRERAGARFCLGATTNGTLAGESVRRFVEEGQVHLLISLDGDAASHEHRPKVGGGSSWEHVRRNLGKLVDCAPTTSIRMTYHPGSLNLVDKVEAAMEIGARWMVLSPVVEAHWAGHEQFLWEQSQRLADWFVDRFVRGETPPLQLYWNWLLDYHSQVTFGPTRPAKACSLGTQILAFDTAGNVLPCHRYLYRKTERLGNVWRDLSLPAERDRFVHLSRAEIPDCSRCVARSVCGGGCRVVAQEAGYGLSGVHPNHCLLTQTQMHQVVSIYKRLRNHPKFLPALASHQQMPLMFQEAQPIEEELF